MYVSMYATVLEPQIILYLCMYTCMYVRMYVCEHAHDRLLLGHICQYACMYVKFTHIHTYTHLMFCKIMQQLHTTDVQTERQTYIHTHTHTRTCSARSCNIYTDRKTYIHTHIYKRKIHRHTNLVFYSSMHIDRQTDQTMQNVIDIHQPFVLLVHAHR